MRWDPPVERRLHVVVNDNIRRVMDEKNLTVHDVADGSGMSRTTLLWRLSRPSTWQLDELALSREGARGPGCFICSKPGRSNGYTV
jgi:hypothetical protein